MSAQEATSRALAQASTPYQQSGARVDILTNLNPCTPVYSAEQDAAGWWPWHCTKHGGLTHTEGVTGMCDGRFEAWA